MITTVAKIDFTYIETLSDGDILFIDEIISTFRTNCDVLIDQMKEELSQSEYVKLGKTAHQLKPSIKMLDLESTETILSIQEEPEKATDEKIEFIREDCAYALKELKQWRTKFE